MSTHCIILVLSFLICSPGYVKGQSIFPNEMILKLDSVALQDVPSKAPGIATAIVQNGQVLYQKIAGFANLEDSTLIKPYSRFNIASNGKQYTALAILVLEDAGKLKLSDDIRKYFPGLFSPIGSKITVQHLLSHTSGIRDVYDLLQLQGITWWKTSMTNMDLLELIKKQKDLNFEPGSSYLYSNTNYILLSLLIEKLSKDSFPVYLKKLFKKMNMPNTSFESDHNKIAEPIARAYFNFNTWTTFKWIWDACGDGNLFSTLDDQIQWEKLVQGYGKSGIKARIIARSQEILYGSESSGYGFGLEFGNYKGLPYRFHEGATGAWKATVLRFTQPKISMLTLTNTGKSIPYTQTRQMADVVLGLTKSNQDFITRPAQQGSMVNEDEIPGVYLTDNNFAFQYIKQDGKLLLRREGRNDIRLEREGSNIFHQWNDPAFKHEFIRNDSGEMVVTAYYTTHPPYSLTRPFANWNNYDFKVFNGSYINEETGTMIEIKHDGETNYSVKIGDNSGKGLLVNDRGLLLVNRYQVKLVNQKAGQILLLDGERIKNVRFTRVL